MAREYVDFKVVKRIPMQLILDHYSIDWLRASGDELIGRCPIHQGEGTRTFHVNLTKNVFNCFSCGAQGGILDFVKAKEQCSIREAALKLKAWSSIRDDASPKPIKPPQRATQPQTPAVVNPPLSFKLRIDPGHSYGKRRGLTKETIEIFGTGLCLSRGIFAGRYVMPLHDSIGSRVGYAGRSIDGSEPKYLFPASRRGFRKSHLVYNLHRLVNQKKPCDSVVVVEGFFSCMRLHQYGCPVVALLGSSLSRQQEDLLTRHFQGTVFMFDGDEAGRRATRDCLSRLSGRIFVRAITLPDGKQPDMLTAKEIEHLLK